MVLAQLGTAGFFTVSAVYTRQWWLLIPGLSFLRAFLAYTTSVRIRPESIMDQPFCLATRAVFRTRLALRIVPGLTLGNLLAAGKGSLVAGRRLISEEEVGSVTETLRGGKSLLLVDLAAELCELPALRKVAKVYLKVPIMDTSAPRDAQTIADFWAAAYHVALHCLHGGSVYVHCTNGRGRTALFLGAVERMGVKLREHGRHMHPLQSKFLEKSWLSGCRTPLCDWRRALFPKLLLMNDGMESLGVDYVKASAPQRHVSTPTFDLQLKQRLGKASDGLGAVVWDCGLALANFLSRNPEVVRGKRVIDLGCGTGIAGIAAAACGAKSIVVSDAVESYVSLALENARDNGFGDKVSGLVMEWGTRPLIANDFDIILCADGLYDSKGYAGLRSCLVADALLVYKRRHPAKEMQFFQPLHDSGRQIAVLGQAAVEPEALRGSGGGVSLLYVYTKKEND